MVFTVLVTFHAAGSQGAGDRIQELYAKARAEEQRGRTDVAVQEYLEILRLDPKLAAAHNNLGRLYYQQGHLEEAVQSFKRACELNPNLEPPHAQMALALFQMGDFTSASSEFKTALKLNPADRNAKLGLARTLTELGNLKGALMLLDQLQQEDSKDAEVLFTQAMVHTKLAEAAVEEIEKVDPNSYLIEEILGNAAEARRDYTEAADHYKKALGRSPEATGLHYLLAHALGASGDLPQALKEYRHALELDPYDYNASWEAARIVVPDNPEEALRLANRALQLKPDLPGALTVRGRALLSLGKPEEAVEDLKRASALHKDDPTIHFQLARAYRQLGLTSEAAAETAIYDRLQRQGHAPNEEQRLSEFHLLRRLQVSCTLHADSHDLERLYGIPARVRRR